MKHPEKIFSGDYSRDMWDEINGAKTIAQLRLALYVVCCRLQELESKIAAQHRVEPTAPAAKRNSRKSTGAVSSKRRGGSR